LKSIEFGGECNCTAEWFIAAMNGSKRLSEPLAGQVQFFLLPRVPQVWESQTVSILKNTKGRPAVHHDPADTKALPAFPKYLA